MKKNLRIALCVFDSKPDNPVKNAGRMVDFVEKAAGNGAEMVVFPELSITGYGIRGEVKPICVFGGKRHEAIMILQNAADRYHVVVTAGLAEKGSCALLGANGGGKAKEGAEAPYLTQAVFTPNNPVVVYRKLHLGPPEAKRFMHGNAVTVVNALDSVFGFQLCYDAHFPELTTHLSVKGSEIIIIPHASPRKTPEEKLKSWLKHLTARAYDNSVFVLAVNQVGEYIKGMTFPGVALALDPAGELIASHTGDEEALLYVDLEKKALDDVRGERMRYFLPNRRDDIFNLSS